MQRDLILAIDQGTTGSTALLVDSGVNVLGTFNVEFPNHYPQPGHVEHDVGEIWVSIREAVLGVLSKTGVDATRIAAIPKSKRDSLDSASCCQYVSVGNPMAVPLKTVLQIEDIPPDFRHLVVT